MTDIRGLDIKNCSAISDIQTRANIIYTLPPKYPELKLFALLMNAFGFPNGIMSKVIDPTGDPDAPWKWHYSFSVSNESIISIQRSWLNIDIFIHGDVYSIIDIKTFLGRNMEKYSKEIETLINSFEKYYVLLNPFKRLIDLCNYSYNKLVEIPEFKLIKPRSLDISTDEQRDFMTNINKYQNYIKDTNYYSTNTIIYTAASCECMLNYLILLRKNPKIDQGAINDFLWEKWSKKIELIDQYCLNINKLDLQEKAIKNLKPLFNARNKIMHSSPLLQNNIIKEMKFFMRIPLLSNNEPFYDIVFNVHDKYPSREEAIRLFKYGMDFVSYIISSIQQEAYDTTKIFLDGNSIGWNDNKKCFSKPFIDEMFFFFADGSYSILDKPTQCAWWRCRR